MTDVTRGQVFRDLLKEKVLNMVDEYCDEGEHQDGQSFWDQFENLDQAYEDLVLYMYHGLEVHKEMGLDFSKKTQD